MILKESYICSERKSWNEQNSKFINKTFTDVQEQKKWHSAYIPSSVKSPLFLISLVKKQKVSYICKYYSSASFSSSEYSFFLFISIFILPHKLGQKHFW